MSGPYIPDISHGKKGDITDEKSVDDIRYYYGAHSLDPIAETHRGGKLETASYEQKRDRTEQS